MSSHPLPPSRQRASDFAGMKNKPHPVPTIGSAALLDRDNGTRLDATAAALALAAPATRFLVLINGRPLIRSDVERTSARILWLDDAGVAALDLDRAEPTLIYLGRSHDDGAARFARASDVADLDKLAGVPLPGALVDLRSLAMQGVMAAAEMSLIAQALMLLNWHEGARFCGRCGSPTHITDAGWKRICEPCAREIYPRIDPVVIMLVTKGGKAVLSREARFPEGMVSTLAGFIEPGEDIDHAVRRETKEEIGLDIGSVCFIQTQPWPFPHSLMIGCIAEATGDELRPDPAEIIEARWYEPDEARAMLEKRHPQGRWLPGEQSLANLLVRTWLDEVERPAAAREA